MAKRSSTTPKKIASYLKSLASRRNSGTVTADDVYRYFRNNNMRLQVNRRISFIKSALREPMFYAVNKTRSTRPAAKSRTISTWTLA